MQKIIRGYSIVTAVILCLTLLVTGIISVNEETSYVISGEKEEVLKVQSTTSQRLFIKTENQTSDSENIEIIMPKKETAIMILSGILPSPFAHIVWSMI